MILPSYGRIYTRNGDEPFPMASVVKVVIMAAAIDGAAEEGRPITIGERDLLEPMITWSDNDSAEVLWRRLGGAKGIDAFLRQKGISGMQMDSYGYWGDSLATPRAVAELMALLVWGDLLAEPGRSYALRLLESVLPSQRWGVTEARAEPSPDEVVGGKNGWYPEDGGWAVNSVGYVVPTTGQNGYAIAILSSRQEDFDGAVANTQALAGMVHQALRRASSTATSVATPAAQD